MAGAILRDNIRWPTTSTAASGAWTESLRRSACTPHHNPDPGKISEHRGASRKRRVSSSTRPQQRDGSKQRCLFAKASPAQLHMAPGSPGILLDIGLHAGQEVRSSFCHSASYNQDLWIVGVDEGYAERRPNVYAVIKCGAGHFVAVIRCLKKLGEVELRVAGETACGAVRMRRIYLRQRTG